MKPPTGSQSLNRREFMIRAVAGTALAAGIAAGYPGFVSAGDPFELPQLPYPENALEPHISSRTMNFHHGKHHNAYIENTKKMVKGTDMAEMALEEVVKRASRLKDKALFNNAAQAWNHAFYWKGMKPKGGGSPTGKVAEMLSTAFGSIESFRQEFSKAAATQFGSGWAWLVIDGSALRVTSTANADTPIAEGKKPLLTLDVWEHAYYLDYQNRRTAYIQAFLDHLINWDFVAENLMKA